MIIIIINIYLLLFKFPLFTLVQIKQLSQVYIKETIQKQGTSSKIHSKYKYTYRGADKPLARPGMKQANVSVRMA